MAPAATASYPPPDPPAATAPAPAPASAPAPAPAPGSAPASEACFPACRDGFVCHEARCISLCNPPCRPGEVCVDGRLCEPAPPHPASPRITEPPPPRKISFDEKSHSAIAFHYGFPTHVELNDERAPGGSSATLGVNLRSDVPVVRYMLVGPMFQFGVYDAAYYFDVDVYLRGRVPIDTESVDFQVWAGIPVGLTFDFLKEDFAPGLDGFALGWNIGVLGGGAVHFSKDFGLMTELGWQRHAMRHGATAGPSVDILLAQWVWNVGFMLKN